MPWLILGASVIGTLIVVAGLVGARTAFQTNRNTATIANYETSLKGWKERAEVQDQKLADYERMIEQRDEQLEEYRRIADQQHRACQASLDALQARYDTIKEILQGAPQLEALQRILREYESAAFRLEEVISRFELIEQATLGDNRIETPRDPSKPTQTPQMPRPPRRGKDGPDAGRPA